VTEELYKLTDQDIVNIDFAEQWIEKAKKKGGKDWEQVKGPIKWVGEKGFNTCVAHLSKKHGIDDAKALCGALKREARKRGELSKEHMGRKEKAKAKKK
jgi:hypothetical protein